MKTVFNGKKVPIYISVLKKQMFFTISFAKQHSLTTSSSVCLARISYIKKDSIKTLCSGEACLLSLHISKGHGHDGISVQMNKICANIIFHLHTLTS